MLPSPFSSTIRRLALLLPALLAGCSIVVAASNESPSPNDVIVNEFDAGAADGKGFSSDPDAAAALPYEGNPLCNASRNSDVCFPDETTGPAACPGSDDAGDAGALACRVTLKGGKPEPVCAAAGTGREKAPCQKSADCDKGYECVGTGQCRRYCCDSATCSTNKFGKEGDAGSEWTFCDPQPTVESSAIRVPVCIPANECKLLIDRQCYTGQTCAIVTPGKTSCVAVGAAKVGESCDIERCSEGLQCLGPVGSRKCHQLCRIDASIKCPGALKCVTSAPLFPDSTVGICE